MNLFISYGWTQLAPVLMLQSHHILIPVLDCIIFAHEQSYSGKNSPKVWVGGLVTLQEWCEPFFKTLHRFIGHWRGRERKMAESFICHVPWHMSWVPSHPIGQHQGDEHIPKISFSPDKFHTRRCRYWAWAKFIWSDRWMRCLSTSSEGRIPPQKRVLSAEKMIQFNCA